MLHLTPQIKIPQTIWYNMSLSHIKCTVQDCQIVQLNQILSELYSIFYYLRKNLRSYHSFIDNLLLNFIYQEYTQQPFLNSDLHMAIC